MTIAMNVNNRESEHMLRVVELNLFQYLVFINNDVMIREIIRKTVINSPPTYVLESLMVAMMVMLLTFLFIIYFLYPKNRIRTKLKNKNLISYLSFLLIYYYSSSMSTPEEINSEYFIF